MKLSHQLKMTELYRTAISIISQKYITIATQESGNSEEKINAITCLFEYLLQQNIKQQLKDETFSTATQMILKKAKEFKKDRYFIENRMKYHRFESILDELSCLENTNAPYRHRSERLKCNAIKKYNNLLKTAHPEVYREIEKNALITSYIEQYCFQEHDNLHSSNNVLLRRSNRLIMKNALQ